MMMSSRAASVVGGRRGRVAGRGGLIAGRDGLKSGRGGQIIIIGRGGLLVVERTPGLIIMIIVRGRRDKGCSSNGQLLLLLLLWCSRRSGVDDKVLEP
jgi:hypothetical protein